MLISMGRCPLCRLPLLAHQLTEGVANGRSESGAEASSSAEAAPGPRNTSDSKLRALLREVGAWDMF